MGSNVGGYGSKNVEFVYPTKFEDVEVIINYLKEGESVVLNLNSMNESDSQRLLDCTSGAVFALNGNIRHVDNNIFLLTPEGFNIKTPDQRQKE
jgi:cell division inhibitor SepF